ncbi:MAG: DUF6036 family nucleotidyltransferase [Kofleriaceae bacterium]
MFAADSLRQALSVLGALLRDRGLTFEIVVVGGGGLLLLGVIQRPTKDLDALALVEAGQYQPARPLPKQLCEAVEDTAAVLNLATDWLNPGPTDQLKQGLPSGFRDRTTRHEFGGLIVHLASRYDQICLKLYAAADSAPGSKHVQDLIELDPSGDELLDAAAWVKQQDAGVEFASFVDSVIAHVEAIRAER